MLIVAKKWGVDVNLHLYKMNNLNAFLVTGISGSVGVMTASYLLKHSKLLTLWGKNSLAIMVLHYPITQLFGKCFRNFIKNDIVQITLCVVGSVIFVTLLSLIGELFAISKKELFRQNKEKE